MRRAHGCGRCVGEGHAVGVAPIDPDGMAPAADLVPVDIRHPPAPARQPVLDAAVASRTHEVAVLVAVQLLAERHGLPGAIRIATVDGRWPPGLLVTRHRAARLPAATGSERYEREGEETRAHADHQHIIGSG